MLKIYKEYRERGLKEQDRFQYEHNFIRTYEHILKDKFKGTILDIGCGDGKLVEALKQKGYEAYGLDINDMNFEKDKIPLNISPDVIMMNAVIEHIHDPTNIIQEALKILKKGGHFIVRTPNFQIDYKDFYNDPTHVKPYTPIGLKRQMEAFGFETIFLEPGVVMNNNFKHFLEEIWDLDDSIKWKHAAKTKGGSKSILWIGRKK